ncbi:hypothetical protein PIB30_092496, partial [Stylosanthes scabra]|nr:hypothetical protein [Stylosanthes scabra]
PPFIINASAASSSSALLRLLTILAIVTRRKVDHFARPFFHLLAPLFYNYSPLAIVLPAGWYVSSFHRHRTFFATYRDFKKFYVKVRSPEDAIPFFLDENLSEKISFVLETESGEKILTTSELLKWDSNRGALVKYLETKVPDCSTAGLKSFFKQRAEREVSTSHVVKVEQGSEVNKPSERRRPVSLKRMRTEDVSGKRVIDLTEGRCCGKDVELETVVEFSRSQQGLHGFDESDSLSLLWSERYPFSVVADGHFQSKADVDMLKRTSKVAAARYVHV